MNNLGFGKQRLINEIIKQTWNVSDTSKIKFSVNDVMFILQELQDNEGRRYLENGGNKIQSFNVFKMFAQQLLYRNIANYDSMLLVSSEKGSGKSSFAIMLAREWCRLLGKRFNPKENLAYSNADVMQKIDSANPFDVLICDESVRFCSTMDWAKCIDGNSLIHTPDGQIKIKDLEGKENFLVYSYNKQTKNIEVRPAEKCLKIKEDIVYEIKTVDGIKIKATKEHKFLTNNGWKQLKNLKIGDEIIGC